MSKVLIMTGGPGVGKTTIVKAILRIIAAKGVRPTATRSLGRHGGSRTGEPIRQLVKVEIDHRRCEQRQRLADDQAADHGVAKGLDGKSAARTGPAAAAKAIQIKPHARKLPPMKAEVFSANCNLVRPHT
jgi:hypothetical protein